MGSLTASLTSSLWSTSGSVTSSFAILLVRQVEIFQTGAECLASLSMELASPLRKDLPRFLRRLGRRRQFGSTADRSLLHMSMEFQSLLGPRRIPTQTLRALIVLRTSWSTPSRERRQKER